MAISSLFAHAWNGRRRFQASMPQTPSIVFYAEDAVTKIYFEPIMDELTNAMGRKIHYLTSAQDDPVLSSENQHIEAFYIGKGAVRTLLFMALKADILVMTMPDLENFYIKRSRAHPVHYVYVFHSLVSTHLADLKGAFDHYDTILCSGPHHVKEIRAAESVYGLKTKDLVEHGYGRLDVLLEEKLWHERGSDGRGSETKKILIAPTWGKSGLFETAYGIELIDILLKSGYRVIARPHPNTWRQKAQAVQALKNRFQNKPGFGLDDNIASADSFFSADCLISDWSGVAIEYAFVTERPVVYIDTPRKIRNPHFHDIACESLEFYIRDKIGVVVSPACLSEVPRHIESLFKEAVNYRKRIADMREKTVFNIGRSGKAGAAAICAIADKIKKKKAVAMAIIVIFFCLSLADKAYAYLDLGSGNFILQSLLAFLLGGLFALKLFLRKIYGFITKKYKKNNR